ncbi:54_t:CDS:1, partial [Acaulospora colombiana]
GFYDTPMAFASFTGGEVYSLVSVLYELQKLKLNNDPHAPGPLPINADLSFAIREAYSIINPDE